MSEIRRLTKQIVGKAKRYDKRHDPRRLRRAEGALPQMWRLKSTRNYKKFQCQNCDFALWKIVSGRQFEAPEIEELITKKQVGPYKDSAALGKPFAAIVKLTPEFEAKFDFGDDQTGDGEAANGGRSAIDFSGKEPVGKCPKCGARVFEHGMNYVCEKSVGRARAATFKTSAMILQQPIDRAQMTKLLARERQTY